MKLLFAAVAVAASLTTVSASSFNTPDLEEGKIISHDAIVKLESQKHNYFLSELIEEGMNIERKKSSSSAEVGDDCKKDKDCKSARDDLFCDKDNGDKVGTCEVEFTSRSSSRAGSTCDRDQDCKKGFFCNNNDRCEATSSNSGDDCKDVNKNLRRSSATKSGCKANARAKRTDKQNRSGGNTSGNRENIGGPCMRDKNCDGGQICCGADINGNDNSGVCRDSCSSNGRSGSKCKKDRDCNGNLECIDKRCESMDAFAAVVA